jgi:3-dehydroquinate synthase
MTEIQKIDFSPSNIEVGSLFLGSFSKVLERYKNQKIVILVDENTHDCCLEFLITSFDFLKNTEVILLPSGEENKVMEVCFQVWQAMTEYQISRSDLVINLGGGVVCDMGGFIASIYKRGLNFIHIPTSLLAMVDAAIGGKNGIDLDGYKNQLGTFNHPNYIFVDPVFLATLPEQEWWNGMAEMLKHGLISSESHFQKLATVKSISELLNLDLIAESISIKTRIVESDPMEKGKRKTLNFGHTFGHALESYFLTREPISHGHAVALGLVLESFLSVHKLGFSSLQLDEIVKVVTRIFEILCPPKEDWDEVWNLMQQDKKNNSGKVKCVLLADFAQPIIDQVIDKDDFLIAMYFLQNLG